MSDGPIMSDGLHNRRIYVFENQERGLEWWIGTGKGRLGEDGGSISFSDPWKKIRRYPILTDAGARSHWIDICPQICALWSRWSRTWHVTTKANKPEGLGIFMFLLDNKVCMTQVLGSWGALALRSVSLYFQNHPTWHYVPFPWISRPTHPGTTFRFLGFPDPPTLALHSVSLYFQTRPPWHYVPFPCISRPTQPGTTYRFLGFPDPPALALRSVSLDFQTHPPWHYIPFPCIFKPTHPGTTFPFPWIGPADPRVQDYKYNAIS